MNDMDTEAARIRAVVAEWMAGCATRKAVAWDWAIEKGGE